jgi:choline-sulfatase
MSSTGSATRRAGCASRCRSARRRCAGEEAGRGDSDYQGYDGRITDAAVDWLKARAALRGRQALGAVRVAGLPAFPADRAAGMVRPLPRGQGALPALYARPSGPTIPMSGRSASVIYQKGFDDQSLRRAIAAYFGLVSYVDHNVGRLVAALEAKAASPAPRGSSIRATTATISARAACGANRRCTRKPPGCR